MALNDRRGTSDQYFEDTWATGDDPWEHATRWYERRKYAMTVAALPRRRYARSFEPGCGTGVLTEMLAIRSDEHIAMERHPRGAKATAARCAHLYQVRTEIGRIPHDWPLGHFDLIVLSEVLYYLDQPTIVHTLERCRRSLIRGGHLVAVHYRPEVDAHTWTGDEVHDMVRSMPGWTAGTQVLDPDFVLDVLAR